MVKRYKLMRDYAYLEGDCCSGVETEDGSNIFATEEKVFILESDYEQLQQERDALAAYCEELKSLIEAEQFLSNAVRFRELLNKSP